MSRKSDRIFFVLILVFIIIAAIGLIFLVVTNIGKNPSDIAFSLIAFVISVAALVMTTLQSVSIARQVRITTRAARLVGESTEQLSMLVKEEHVIEKEIRQDIAMDQEIFSILEEYGIGDNQDERKKVATKIAEKVDKMTKK